MINVLSLFNGFSGAYIALKEAGFKIKNYYAVEIDKHCNKIATAIYPKTIHLGDIKNINASQFKEPIHFLIGGSPCQSFSVAGKKNGMTTIENIEVTSLEQYLELKKQNFEFQGESYLFWEYVRLLKELKPQYFILENVYMSKKWELVISRTLGMNPVLINSNLVSAQNRERNYWTNIGLTPSGLFDLPEPTIKQPKDLGLFLKDILEKEVEPKYFLSEKALSYFFENSQKQKDKGNGFRFSMIENANTKSKTIVKQEGCQMQNNFIKCDKKGKIKDNQDKASCFTAGGHSGGNHSDMDIIVHSSQPRSSKSGKGGTGHLSKKDNKSYCLDTNNSQYLEIKKVIQLNQSKESGGHQPYQQNRIYDIKGIAPALLKEKSDLLISNNLIVRRLTPRECARLQTVPEPIINKMLSTGVADIQLYKMLGNGFTINVIKHIIQHSTI